jgi:hypothetical protein
MRYGLEAAALLTKKAGPTKTRFSPGKLGTLGNGTSALSVAKAATYATSENQHLCDEPMSAPAHTRTSRWANPSPESSHPFIPSD